MDSATRRLYSKLATHRTAFRSFAGFCYILEANGFSRQFKLELRLKKSCFEHKLTEIDRLQAQQSLEGVTFDFFDSVVIQVQVFKLR